MRVLAQLAAWLAISLLLAAAAPAPLPAEMALPLWQGARDVVQATSADVTKSGFAGIQRHVPELERVLALANPTSVAAVGKDKGYVLADGQAEVVVASLWAAAQPWAKGRQVAILANPYPLTTMLLASYYNEAHRPADALRVLDKGLALPTVVSDMPAGQYRPVLMSERGVALGALKRWPEALAAYDEGLRLPNLAEKVHGRLLRGRGFVLTEMNRLDEAEAAYRTSLAVEPGNVLAQKELRYIAGIRAGAAPTAAQQLAPGMQRSR